MKFDYHITVTRQQELEIACRIAADIYNMVWSDVKPDIHERSILSYPELRAVIEIQDRTNKAYMANLFNELLKER